MKNFLIYSYLVVAVFACKKDSFEIDNLNNNQVIVLGHAGMGIDKNYPMNSLESILACLNIGANGSEMDVQMTKDGVLVAYHDQLLEAKTNGRGKIYEQNWDDISQLTYKYPPLTNYAVQKVEDILAHIPNQEQFVFSFECKNYKPDVSPDYYTQFNTSLLNLIDQFDLGSRCNFEFSRVDVLNELKQVRPELNLYVYSNFERAMELALTYKLKGIVLSVNDISKDQVALAHSNNIWVCVFNTHSKNKNIDAFQKNVDIVQTDKLQHAVSLQN